MTTLPVFSRLVPHETLLYYDGPLSFTVHDDDGRLYYAHASDFLPGGTEYLVRLVTEADIASLDRVPIRDFLLAGEPLYAVRDYDDGRTTVSVADKNQLDDCLPTPGVILGETAL